MKVIVLTRQQNIFMTLMQNYDQVLKAQTLEANSAGLAQQRYAIYLDSVEAATNRQTPPVPSVSTGHSVPSEPIPA